MHKALLTLLILFPLCLNAQASFTAIGSPYTQNFNTLPNTVDGGTPTGGWTDNATLTGWYSSVSPVVESSTTSMNNTGANYIIASGADRSIGGRPSNSTGTCYYGVRIANNTGTTITSVYIQYYGEQWSIAENGSNVNSISVSYRVGAGLTSLTTGTWTNAAALTFTQLYTSSQSAGMGGTACGGTSNQCLSLNGNAAGNRTLIGACIAVSITAGQEIMIRWTDANDGSNDHHLQIDDVAVYPYTVSCATVLPVEWLSFTAEKQGAVALLQWETASEQNNDYFAVERIDAEGNSVTISVVDGSGTTSQVKSYSFTDEQPVKGTNYYRIRQVDFNGEEHHSEVRVVEFGSDAEPFSAFTFFDGELRYRQSGNTGATRISVLSDDGRILSSISTEACYGSLDPPQSSGIYFIRFENENGVVIVKQLLIF
jgi:hypothetical protein